MRRAAPAPGSWSGARPPTSQYKAPPPSLWGRPPLSGMPRAAQVTAARGQRLDIPAGTAIRFEPGDSRDVNLIPFAGARRVIGFNGQINGPLDA